MANNQVLAVEGPEDTDQTLARVAELRRDGRIRTPVGSGVLVKAPKLGQDHRIDLPVIGPPTIEAAARPGSPASPSLPARPSWPNPNALPPRPIARRDFRHRRRAPTGPIDDGRRAAGVRAGRTVPGGLEMFLVAAEESGDRLGAALMRALRRAFRRAGAVLRRRRPRDDGRGADQPVSDRRFRRSSASPPFPRRLPRLSAHMAQTVRAVMARTAGRAGRHRQPGVHPRVCAARRAAPIRRSRSSIMSRHRSGRGAPGRARSMRGYIDHVLALLPFEPEVHQRLGGPPCSYVGHPLSEECRELRPNEAEARRRLSDPPVVLAMPGSRSGEIDAAGRRYSATALALVRRTRRAARSGGADRAAPARAGRRRRPSAWRVKPRDRCRCRRRSTRPFRIARAALAKSGTATLELAVAGVPMVAAYKVSRARSAGGAAARPGAVRHPRQSGDRGERRARS